MSTFYKNQFLFQSSSEHLKNINENPEWFAHLYILGVKCQRSNQMSKAMIQLRDHRDIQESITFFHSKFADPKLLSQLSGYLTKILIRSRIFIYCNIYKIFGFFIYHQRYEIECANCICIFDVT